VDPHFDLFIEEILKLPKSSGPYVKAGRFLLSKGYFDESLGFLKKALILGEDSFDVHFLLGKVYTFLSCSQKSLQHLKEAQKKRPTHKETQYLLGILSEEERLKANSLDSVIIKRLFDDYASQFENHLVKELSYETPKKLSDYFFSCRKSSPVMPVDGRFRVLDLGCGTGLFGKEFLKAQRGSSLIGVDLSLEMLKQAMKKNIYSRLYEGDLLECLKQENKKNTRYDLIASCDTVPYLGSLEELFVKSCQLLKKGGAFLFSFEVLDDSEKQWELSPNGRFKHKLGYVEDLARLNSLVFKVKRETLRQEKGERVNGCFFWGSSIKIGRADKGF